MNKTTALALAIVGLLLSSCGSVKDVAYLQDSENKAIIASTLYESKIAPKDLLTINIQSSKPELTAPFNGMFWSPQQQYSSTAERLRTYLVSNEGIIDLPILGQVKVGGLSIIEAENKVRERLKEYFKETPSVNIRINNYRYAVIGEVKRAGVFNSENGKVNIFDALANAGDMTIYGDRDHVKLMRELPDGSKQIIDLNLKDINLISSPYFYLQQGDVLYVQPNKAQAKASNVSSGVTIWFSVASISLTVVNLLATLLRR